MNFIPCLISVLENAVRKAGFDTDAIHSQIRPGTDPKFGDYQFNGAMGLSKKAGIPPRLVAEKIVANLELPDFLHPPEIAGPGFLNLRIQEKWLAEQMIAMVAGDRLGVEISSDIKTFIVDFSSPNVAKPMHVGHLRSTILGDSIARILRFLGHKVITDNHLGDWGTQFGIILYGFKHFLDKEAFAKDPVAELARLYVDVRKKFNAQEDVEETTADPVQDACRNETAKLHHGDQENLALWKQFMPYCQQEIDEIYQRLDVKFDHTYGESFYQPMLPEVVKSLKERGLAVESEGAIAVFLKEDAPPALVQKRDGAFTYMTTDLATIKYRLDQWKPDAILYVVDSRQALHFSHLFEISKKWLGEKTALHHVSFGSVLGADRKPIKTRSGDAVASLANLLDEAVKLAKATYEESRKAGNESESSISDEDLQNISEIVGVGAVKYADLSQNRTSDYVFNWDKMLAMDGNTATYMQYAYARNRSIFRKSEISLQALYAQKPKVLLETPEERSLAIQLFRFEEALRLSVQDFRPNQITAYLWDLAKAYSVFFQKCPVLKATSNELKLSRLTLCDLTARVLKQGLHLLGIQVLEKM
ncbi:MAG: Arginine--tRNA ligase [Planctomycetota bacterium]